MEPHTDDETPRRTAGTTARKLPFPFPFSPHTRLPVSDPTRESTTRLSRLANTRYCHLSSLLSQPVTQHILIIAPRKPQAPRRDAQTRTHAHPLPYTHESRVVRFSLARATIYSA